MIKGLAILLAFQLVGETLAHASGVAIPGPVVGMVLLALCLGASRGKAEPLERDIGGAADGLLSNLGMLFVPTGVGIIQHTGLLARHGPGLVLVLVASAAITLVATVWVFVLAKKVARGHGGG